MTTAKVSRKGLTPTELKQSLPLQFGYWSALLTTLSGVVYFIVVLISLIVSKFAFPPSEGVQLFGGVATLIGAPLTLVLIIAIHFATPAEKRIFSVLGIVFGGLFTVVVSINRFVQLSIVRLSIIEGDIADLRRFLPYDGRSAMFALEILGWALFLSLALLSIAFVFSASGVQGWIRYSFILYAVLGLICSVAFIVGSPLSAIGFVAWGFVLYIGSGALTAAFYRMRKSGYDTFNQLN